MADNVSANGVPVATRSVTYSGDAAQNAQVVGLVAFSGADDAKTATDVPFPTALGAHGGFVIEGVASGTTVPVSTPDGGNVAIGSTSDASSANTLVGLLKKLASLLPAALGSQGALKVEGVASGTAQPVSGTITASNTAGDLANDAVDSGNPVKIGGRAVSHGSAGTVASGDRIDFIGNRHGAQYVIGGDPNVVSTRVNYTSAQTNAVIGPTNAAGTRMMLTQIMVTSDNAMTTFPSVLVGFGTTTTPTGDGVVFDHPGIPAGGGGTRGSGSAVIAPGGDGEELRVTTGTITGGSISIVITYYLTS